MVQYIFKDGPLTIKGAKDADPQLIGETLAALADLEPKTIVDAAREADSPIHAHFDWNDAEAAEKWRLDQARALVRSIRVEEGKGEDNPPAFISIRTDDGVGYHSIAEVRNSGDLSQRMLAAAERDLESFQFRYRVLKDVCAHVEKAKKAVRAKRSENESRAAA